ncbi:MAG: hypothetical protein QOI46_5069, partial [Alphaproteobacteria bacterium]|nr:hypothetical protein [Alphaproteobacteria bacterium]
GSGNGGASDGERVKGFHEFLRDSGV